MRGSAVLEYYVRLLIDDYYRPTSITTLTPIRRWHTSIIDQGASNTKPYSYVLKYEFSYVFAAQVRVQA